MTSSAWGRQRRLIRTVGIAAAGRLGPEGPLTAWPMRGAALACGLAARDPILILWHLQPRTFRHGPRIRRPLGQPAGPFDYRRPAWLLVAPGALRAGGRCEEVVGREWPGRSDRGSEAAAAWAEPPARIGGSAGECLPVQRPAGGDAGTAANPGDVVSTDWLAGQLLRLRLGRARATSTSAQRSICTERTTCATTSWDSVNHRRGCPPWPAVRRVRRRFFTARFGIELD